MEPEQEEALISTENRFSIVWLVPLLIGFLSLSYGCSMYFFLGRSYAQLEFNASQYIFWGSLLLVWMIFFLLNPDLACFKLTVKRILTKLIIVQIILSGLVLYMIGYFGFPFPFLRVFTRFELGNLATDNRIKFFFLPFFYDALLVVGISIIIAAMKCRARELPLKESARF